VKKHRGLYEDPSWQESRAKLDPSVRRFDEAFRFFTENISTEPYVNTTAFLGEDHRILVANFPGVAEVWVYFRVEPDDNNCTLLWLESRGPRLTFRVG
jgi:hypothetical protein